MKVKECKFVKCVEKSETTNTKYGPRSNDPVNLSVVERIAVGRERYYPDNEGIPVIEFYREGKQIYQWFFDKDEEKTRDKVFKRLLKENS